MLLSIGKFMIWYKMCLNRGRYGAVGWVYEKSPTVWHEKSYFSVNTTKTGVVEYAENL